MVKFERKICIDLDSIAYFLSVFVSIKTYKINNLARLTYKGCDIGRHTMSLSQRGKLSTKYKLVFFLNFIRIFIHSLSIITQGYRVKQNIDAAFIDHGVYINGLLMQLLLNHNIPVYYHAYPYSLSCITPKKDYSLKFEDIVKLRRDNIRPGNFHHTEKRVNSILKDPNLIPYMDVDMERNLKDFKNTDYVLYLHFFTDSQLYYGFDGFKGIYDWTIFTIDSLLKINKSVSVKAHPLYFMRKRENSLLQDWDREIFQSIVNRYKDNKLVSFIRTPISNYNYLSQLDSQKTILITHHSNSILEGEYLGFKSISSICSPWGGVFDVSNVWRNKEEYWNLLQSDVCNLATPNHNEIIKCYSSLFDIDSGFYSNNFYQEIISEIFNVDRKSTSRNQEVIRGSDSQFSKAINKIKKTISVRRLDEFSQR